MPDQRVVDGDGLLLFMYLKIIGASNHKPQIDDGSWINGARFEFDKQWQLNSERVGVGFPRAPTTIDNSNEPALKRMTSVDDSAQLDTGPQVLVVGDRLGGGVYGDAPLSFLGYHASQDVVVVVTRLKIGSSAPSFPPRNSK